MKCDQVLAVLEDYSCGALQRELAASVKSHISNCATCGREFEILSAEDRLYREYQQAVEQDLDVNPGMWRAVTAGLEPKSRGGRGVLAWPSGLSRQFLLAAALIVVSVGATLLAVRYYETGNRLHVAGLRRPPERVSTLEGALRSIQRAEQEYIQAIQVLNGIVDKRKSTMDPQLVIEFEASLKAIDENIAATRKAYHEHPTDAELAHFMLAAYSRKVELLQELAS